MATHPANQTHMAGWVTGDPRFGGKAIGLQYLPPKRPLRTHPTKSFSRRLL